MQSLSAQHLPQVEALLGRAVQSFSGRMTLTSAEVETIQRELGLAVGSVYDLGTGFYWVEV